MKCSFIIVVQFFKIEQKMKYHAFIITTFRYLSTIRDVFYYPFHIQKMHFLFLTYFLYASLFMFLRHCRSDKTCY